MIATVLAAEQIIREIEWGLPESGLGWLAMVLGTALLLVFVVACYLRDTRDMSRLWTGWLLMLRLAVIVGLLLVFLNPRERESEKTFRPSRVILLVDTSLSMSFPENTPGGRAVSGGEAERTRALALRELLSETPLVKTLIRDHQVRIYTFDARLEDEPVFEFASRDPRGRPADDPSSAGEGSDDPELPTADAWDRAIRPWSVAEDETASPTAGMVGKGWRSASGSYWKAASSV